MDVWGQLRTVRRSLLDRMLQVDSAGELYQFQLKLAEAIQAAERVAWKTDSDEHKRHIHLLRSYGDALAWMLLHPHTIRQLANNPSAPPSLTGQAGSFEGTLQAAADYTSAGIPVLICDITNCLKIGDLVLCLHPERPGLVECKTRLVPRFIMQGRTGRQVSRMISTLEYLYEGTAKVYGDSEPRLTVDVTAQADYSWEAVEAAVTAALGVGLGFAAAGDCDVVWACTADDDDLPIPREMKALASDWDMRCVGCHARALEEAKDAVPPPAAWPIDADCRFALMEVEVLLFHLVDLQHFTRIATKHGQISKVLTHRTASDEYDHIFVVVVGGEEYQFSSRFLWDVLYGFQTIESTANIITESAVRVHELECLDTAWQPTATSKPQVRIVRSIEEARRLKLEIDAVPRSDLVVGMPYSLFRHLREGLKDIRSAKSHD